MKNTILISLACGLLMSAWWSCGSDSHASLSEHDLLQYGIPITIRMPDSAEVKTMDWGVQKDVTIEGEGNYSMQIFSSKTADQNLASALNEQKELVKSGPYFSKFIIEENDGFVFEMMVDTVINYDFRHLKIQGGNEYLFQGGLASKQGRDQIESLYMIAKEAR